MLKTPEIRKDIQIRKRKQFRKAKSFSRQTFPFLRQRIPLISPGRKRFILRITTPIGCIIRNQRTETFLPRPITSKVHRVLHVISIAIQELFPLGLRRSIPWTFTTTICTHYEQYQRRNRDQRQEKYGEPTRVLHREPTDYFLR